MSDYGYKIFREITNLNIPPLSVIRAHLDILNSKMPKIIVDSFGKHYDTHEKIKYVLEHEIKYLNIQNNTIRISIRGDKTICGKNESFFNFCFSLIDDEQRALSVFGQYTIGLYRLKDDNYENLSLALNKISTEMESMNRKIIVNEKTYEIDWSIGGDMAWLKVERGLNNCNSKNPCVHCTIPKKDFYKDNKAVINENLRSVAQTELNLKKTKSENKGCLNKPIFHFIDHDKIYTDPMHEHARIPNKIFQLTYKKLIVLDNSNSKDFEKLKNQKKFRDFLTGLKIKDPINIKNEKSKEKDPNFSLKSFSGIQCKKICSNIKIGVLSGLTEEKNIVSIYNNYYRINQGYTHCFYIDKTELLQKRIDDWAKEFNSIFPIKDNTVYIHNLKEHIVKKIETDGDINLWNMQGLEKLNDFTTMEFYRKTNRKDDVVQQILNFRSRLEYYRFISKDGSFRKLNEKRESQKRFFKKIDLYEINDLSKIPVILKKFRKNENKDGFDIYDDSEDSNDDFDLEDLMQPEPTDIILTQPSDIIPTQSLDQYFEEKKDTISKTESSDSEEEEEPIAKNPKLLI
jgi:hypothetical protein